MAVTPMLLGAPELPPELKKELDAAIAACERIRNWSDMPFSMIALALLQIRVSAVLADPFLQVGVGILREEGRFKAGPEDSH